MLRGFITKINKDVSELKIDHWAQRIGITYENKLTTAEK